MLTCVVRAVAGAGYGLLFSVAALALTVLFLVLPATNAVRRFLAWLGRGSVAGQRLAIIIVVAPAVVLAFAFGVDPGRLLAGIFWLVAALPCGVFAFLAGRATTAHCRTELGGGKMVAGPALFAATISTFFVLGVAFGDDPWSNWMPVGFVLGVCGLAADTLWALPSARRYVADVGLGG